MTEALSSDAAAGAAGAMLRAARQKQGLHIGMLAASIKVAPAKLEALESGRYDALPDATFTRALALSVCRALKIDPAPVLALLPATPAVVLDRTDRSLNQPFRERPGRIDPADWGVLRQPLAWLVLGLLLAAAAFTFAPARLTAGWNSDLPRLLSSTTREPASAPMPIPASAVLGSAVELVTATVPAGPAGTADANTVAAAPAPLADAASAPLEPARGLRLRATEASWVRVVDARGQVLLQRLLSPGESIDVEGITPLQARVGNARGTELVWRGKPIDLIALTRDNVASLELP